MALAKIASVGPPPEKHADRVVAEMLRLIVRVHARILDDMHLAFKDRSDGNPIGQKRMLRRIREGGGSLLFDVFIETGKRGRYELIVTELVGWDAAAGAPVRGGWNIVKGRTDNEDHPAPTKPWIGCAITQIKSKGRGHYEMLRKTPLLITHHALSRLAQRGNVREAADLVAAVHAIWFTYLRADVEAIKALEAGAGLEVRSAGRRVAV